MRIISLLFICAHVGFLSAQNAGIGTATPGEKLEVAGIIYTNEGGIKFPDQTVQTTAAFNAPPATESTKHAGGFARFFKQSLDGPLDTLGLGKVSLLYDIIYPMVSVGGIGPVHAGPVTILKETDRGTPGFYQHVATGTHIANVELYLTRFNATGDPEIYMIIYMKNAVPTQITTQLSKAYYGYYSNVDLIEFNAQEIAIKDLVTGSCFCYEPAANTSCSCP